MTRRNLNNLISVIFLGIIAPAIVASSESVSSQRDSDNWMGFPVSKCNPGLEAYEGNKYNNAIKTWVKDLCPYKGLAERYYVVNKCLIGTGIVETNDDLITWYKSAASEGVDEAEVFLAQKYYKSENPFKGALDKLNHPDIKPKMTETIFWANQAIEHNNPDGKFILVRLYLQGLGVEKNIDVGINLMKEAAINGSISASTYLILMYKNGIDGNYSDPDKEQYWREYHHELAEKIGSSPLSY